MDGDSLDGWSNIHNESIICVTVTTKTGEVYLTDTVDTGMNAHNAEYLAEIAVSSIQKCERDFQCHVRSVVTDNTGNVSSMRSILLKNKDLNVIAYGCSAHILNLLAKDIKYPNIKEQIVQVIKYFRNKHFASACFRELQGQTTNVVKLVLPSEVRWNSIVDSLESYLKGWPILVQVCEQHRDKVDGNIRKLILDINVKRNAENMFQLLKPIAVALDKVQRSDCALSKAVGVWKELRKTFKDIKVEKAVWEKFEFRYNMALTPAHFLCYMLDPNKKDDGMELSEKEKKLAMEFAKISHSNCLLPLTVKFLAKTSPFQECFFEEQVLKNTKLYEWWKSQKTEIDKFNADVFSEIEQLITAQASSAGIERVFSLFGWVQSKIRNRLRTEKAAKLVFIHKMFNEIV